MPQARTRTSTSNGAGLGVGTSRYALAVETRTPPSALKGVGPVPSPDSALRSASRGRPRFSSAARSAMVRALQRSEEHTSELQSLMRISYAVFCLKKKTKKKQLTIKTDNNANKQN